MPDSQAWQDFGEFMRDYVDFLEEMANDEGRKLEALSRNDLPQIEHNIVVSLANAKKLENYEHKRLALMESVGMTGKTFGEMLDLAPDEDKASLTGLFNRFEHGVSEIKFRNDKSMDVAHDNLVIMNPEAAILSQGGSVAKPHNQYEKMKEEQRNQGGMLEQKA